MTTGTFGKTASYEGLDVGVGKPATFTPSEYAAGFESGDKAFVIVITVKNTGSDKFDPALFHTTASAGGQECQSVFDSAKNIEGSPSTSVLPGKSVAWKEVYACKAKAGADLTMDVTPGFEFETVTFTGTMP